MIGHDKRLYYYHARNARNRGYLPLSQDIYINLTKMRCHYCGDHGVNKEIYNGIVFRYNGVDRIDSNEGYLSDNIVPCCKYCNKMKNHFDYDFFINQCRKIGEHV